MPLSSEFDHRLNRVINSAVTDFGTPFHIYDEKGIRQTCARFKDAFSGFSFRQFFAVKALPNPAVMRILHEEGFGFDCSSGPELTLAGLAGATGEDICFTSNNTTRDEADEAMRWGAALNIDDVNILEKLDKIPDFTMFRVNPGSVAGGDSYMGQPQESKFGVPTPRLEEACRRAVESGARSIGLHMMLASNSLVAEPVLRTLDLLLEHAESIQRRVGCPVPVVNLGGGLGIPYRASEKALDIDALGLAIGSRLEQYAERVGRPAPEVWFESGRYITGPHGALVTSVINRMSKWREYVGVDAGMSSLMRPALYGAYHHITVPFARTTDVEIVDVVGSLCENSDKLAEGRELPRVSEGDVLIVHDTGAHGQAMGYTYNGRLRPQELLLADDGRVHRIRRAEEEADYLATLIPHEAGR